MWFELLYLIYTSKPQDTKKKRETHVFTGHDITKYSDSITRFTSHADANSKITHTPAANRQAESLCDADPTTSKSAGAISSAVRQTTGRCGLVVLRFLGVSPACFFRSASFFQLQGGPFDQGSGCPFLPGRSCSWLRRSPSKSQVVLDI